MLIMTSYYLRTAELLPLIKSGLINVNESDMSGRNLSEVEVMLRIFV